MPATTPTAPLPGAGLAAAPAEHSPSSGRRRGGHHSWLVQTVLALVVLLVGAATAVYAHSTVQGIVALGMFPEGTDRLQTVPTVWLAGAAVGAVLLVALRTRPLLAVGILTALALASLVTAGIFGVLGLCLAVALYSVASTRPALVTWSAVVAVVAVLTTATWRWQVIGVGEMVVWGTFQRPAGTEPFHQLIQPEFSSGRRSATVALLVVLLLLGVAAGASSRARRLKLEAEADHREAAARDREASAALGRASERARIAREMHDIVAHSVSVMIALSDGAGAALDRAPDRSREALRELSATGRTALADMQRVLGALDPDGERGPSTSGSTGPTETDLRTIVDRFRAAGLPVTAEGVDLELPAGTSVRLALVRIVSEALTNVLRHAPGTTAVTVHVRWTGTTVEAEVVDAGSDEVAAGSGSGRGIPGMRDRAALLGGHVEAGLQADGGWRVHVVLPVGTPATTTEETR